MGNGWRRGIVEIKGMQTKQDVARDGGMMMLKLIRVIEFLHNGGLMSRAFQKLEVEVAEGLQCS